MLKLSIDTSELKRLDKEFGRLQARLPQAIARGLNQGGDKVRTQVQRALQEQTGLLLYGSVTKRMRTQRAYETGAAAKSGIGPSRGPSLNYALYVVGKPTKAWEFASRVEKGKDGGVIIRMWNKDHKFKRSFQIGGSFGQFGLRMRLGKERFPIRGFDGPNLAKEAVEGKSAAAFTDGAATLVMPRIAAQIIGILK